ncbi:MAG: hypothetical protein IJB67_01205 [Firmicutes bacterium]|nr:hypothetical protein [Bacillota bacterium]
MRRNDGYVLVFVLAAVVFLSMVAVSVSTFALRGMQQQQAAVAQTQDRYEAAGKIEQVVADASAKLTSLNRTETITQEEDLILLLTEEIHDVIGVLEGVEGTEITDMILVVNIGDNRVEVTAANPDELRTMLTAYMPLVAQKAMDNPDLLAEGKEIGVSGMINAKKDSEVVVIAEIQATLWVQIAHTYNEIAGTNSYTCTVQGKDIKYESYQFSSGGGA